MPAADHLLQYGQLLRRRADRGNNLGQGGRPPLLLRGGGATWLHLCRCRTGGSVMEDAMGRSERRTEVEVINVGLAVPPRSGRRRRRRPQIGGTLREKAPRIMLSWPERRVLLYEWDATKREKNRLVFFFTITLIFCRRTDCDCDCDATATAALPLARIRVWWGILSSYSHYAYSRVASST